MNLRGGLSISTCAVALLIGVGPMVPGALAAEMPTKAKVWTEGAPPLDGWWSHGEIEVGGRIFLNDPSREGRNAQNENSLAKYYEYSSVMPGPFGNIKIQAGTNNGLYGFDFLAKNIGYSDQHYSLDWSKAGEHYLSLGWDQTPHVYSTSARTIFDGVGTNSLTIAGAIRDKLSAHKASGPLLTDDIQSSVHQTDIGIRRDTASVDYRYTPTDAWDIKVAYSSMHRSGSQVDSVPLGTGSSTALVQVPKPVNDTTQNFGVNGEYAGTSSWGKKFNIKFAYNGSVYQEADEFYTVQNPFCNSAGVGCLANQYDFSRMSLWPSNQANGVSASGGADLPWNSRYMGTVNYTMMRQNEAFQPFSTNPASVIGGISGTSLSALPALSLDGKINTLLVNNVLTTQITPDLKSKLSYRYYDYDNQTPLILFPLGILRNDSATAPDFAMIRSIPVSYTKQNAGAELNWRPTRQWNLGAAYGHEHYNWTYADVDSTGENTGKVFADWKMANWAMLRASYLYGQRRYNTYDHVDFLANYQDPTGHWAQNPSYRQFMFANRDRQVAKMSIAIDLMPRVTFTPSAGLRYDNYPVASELTNQDGLLYDNSWNAGAEISYVMNPDTTFLVSYLREDYKKLLIQQGGGNALATDIRTYVDTLMFMVNYAVIPNKLDLTLRMTNSWARDAYTTNVILGGFSDVVTTFQRFDAIAKYKIDPDVVQKLGWKGQVTAKLRYAWERNSVGNWQNDLMDVYMFSKDPSSINQIYLGYANPNYDVHLIAASLAFKW